MKNLVTKTIELARLNSPNSKFNYEDTNLLSEINKVIETNKILFEENDIQIINNVSDDIQVSADRLRLEELFNNLLNNSVKYTEGKGSITIDAKSDECFVTVSVSDTGIGMSGEELSHIFDEFYKADSSRHDFQSSGLGMSICQADSSRHDFQSSGLGMSICHRIIEHHGGKIWAESKGKRMGSTFYFTLRVPTNKTSELNFEGYNRIRIIQHKGKDIIYLNYSNLKDDEYEKATDEITDFIFNLEKSDLLVLTNVDGNIFNYNQIKSTKKTGVNLKPYLKKNAVIGISKNQAIFLKAIKLFSDIQMKHFENIEDAKDWLVK
jgi:anti-sigma regulatory factor (Ser/Thr protein kinase)